MLREGGEEADVVARSAVALPTSTTSAAKAA